MLSSRRAPRPFPAESSSSGAGDPPGAAVVRRTLIRLRSQFSCEEATGGEEAAAADATAAGWRAEGGPPARRTFAPRLRSPRKGSSLVLAEVDGATSAFPVVSSRLSLVFLVEGMLITSGGLSVWESVERLGKLAAGGGCCGGLDPVSVEKLDSATMAEIEALKLRFCELAERPLLLLLFSCCG